MIIPPYKYLIGENKKSFVFDNNTSMKAVLGKKTEGWNLGYQCMAGVGVYRNQLGSMSINSIPTLLSTFGKDDNLDTCLTLCRTAHGITAAQVSITTGKVGCCMFNPDNKTCHYNAGAANLAYTGKVASYILFQ